MKLSKIYIALLKTSRNYLYIFFSKELNSLLFLNIIILKLLMWLEKKFIYTWLFRKLVAEIVLLI